MFLKGYPLEAKTAPNPILYFFYAKFNAPMNFSFIRVLVILTENKKINKRYSRVKYIVLPV